jgi:antitoxin MazE
MGNSHGLVIPKLVLDEIGVTAGDPVSLKVNKKGKLVISPVRSKARTGWAEDSKAVAQAGEAGGDGTPLKW